MIVPVSRNDGSLDWILALAPYRRDADYLEMLLSQHGLSVQQAAGLEEFAALLEQSPGILVATHEALKPDVLELVRSHLLDQPDWSEMPIIILLDRAAPHARIRAELSAAWPGSRQLYYQRPVATLELVSGVQSALLARLRQRDVRDHIEREIELRRELNHRVKNILASVSSIFSMTRRSADSLERFAEDFGGRLMALANIHSVAFEADGESVELAQVADLTLKPYQTSSEDRIIVEGPGVTLRREAATTLALCFHELATNALKYGALSQPGGRVQLHWAVSATDAILTIQWIESGGPPVREPSRSGYGTSYLRSALRSVFGSPPAIVYRPEGLHFTISGPLSRVWLKR
ncbi:sensor histidine kinase [Sphingomonas sp. DT-204]|uniref:sensor histidine kinase n=1 Tax=Sphingomonas sp. DT-204 TaxID=3396166 RepID=UPI003F1CDA79